jgi:hypothetical protein
MTTIIDSPSKPARSLLDISPHRTIGGIHINGLTPYPAEYESYNEKHAILTLALCHDVLEIRSQPKKFSYLKESGKIGFHIPDIEVLTPNGSEFIEVKAIENLLKPEVATKYGAIAKNIRREGISYSFLTNIQIEVMPRFYSVRLLYRYLNADLCVDAVNLAKMALSAGQISIQDLALSTGLGLGEIYTLIANRHLCFDWLQPLDSFSMVSLPNQPYRGLSFADIQRSTWVCGLLEELALGCEPTNQYIVATAKNWRQADNLPGIWGMVGGYIPKKAMCDLKDVGFLRGPQYRRAIAPGEINKGRSGRRRPD